MREIRKKGLGAAGILAAVAFLVAGCSDRLNPEDLAQAGDFRLGIDEAARMVAPVAGLQADETVMQAVVDFWIDYVLLAWVVNQEEELQELDLTHVVDFQVSNALVDRLRNSVIQVREITDADLRLMFEQNRPGLAVRARHVLVPFPENASAAQRDSVRRLAEQVRDQARAGVDFPSLAQRYSSDTGSAALGGDLGFFERGQMVLPFEDAAFALRPGQVSDVVQSEFGLHVIKLEERREPVFEEVAEEYRAQLEFEGMAQAESIYLAQIEGPANIVVAEDAVARTREIASEMDRGMRGGAAGEALVRFEGGEYTAGEFRNFLLGQPIELRDQINRAPDDQVDGLLRDLALDRLLVADARARGVVVLPEEIAAYEGDVRARYRTAAEELGLYPIEPEGTETLAEAVDRRVGEMMARLVRGEQNLVPLGGLANPFRELYPVRTSPEALTRAVARVETIRRTGTGTEAPVTTPEPATPPPVTQP